MQLHVCPRRWHGRIFTKSYALLLPEEAWKIGKDLVGNLLEPAKSVLDALNVVSQVHPAATVCPLRRLKTISLMRVPGHKGCRWSVPGRHSHLCPVFEGVDVDEFS